MNPNPYLHRTHHPRLLLAACAAVALPSLALAQTTITFQNGVGGYNGTSDRTLSDDLGSNLAGGFNDYYFLDGDARDNAPNGNDSPDVHGLIRFDHLIGSGPGQVPAGAFILDARLTLTTAPTVFSSNSNTGGPWGVAQLLQPFSLDSMYADYGPTGPQVAAGSINRPVSAYGDTDGNDIMDGEVVTSFVGPIVQQWASGAANHGFDIASGPRGTTNGWAIATSSSTNVAERPQLSVTYTTDPVTTVSFQQGVNGYAGTTSTWINRSPDGTDTLEDADAIGFEFLDGPNDTSAGGSADSQLNLRFGDLFASEGGAIPDDAIIVKAHLVLSTTLGESGSAYTGEPFDVSQLLVPFDDNTGFADFGGNGPDELDGEVGPVVDQTIGGVEGGEGWFDVTSILAAWQAGDENFGFNLQGSDIDVDLTDDGWQIYFPGAADASVRPELIVSYSVVPEPTTLAMIGMGGLALLRRRRA